MLLRVCFTLSIYLAVNRALKNKRTGNVVTSCFKLCSSTTGQTSCSFLVNSSRIEAGAINNIILSYNISNSGSVFRIKANGLIVDNAAPSRIYYKHDGLNVDIYMSVETGYVIANVLPLHMSSLAIDMEPIIVSEIPSDATEVSIQ